MDAPTFYEQFESTFTAAPANLELRRLAGKTSRWRYRAGDQSLLFAFATNFKTAGLLPHLVAEFRLTLTWEHGERDEKRTDCVSLFQYTTQEEDRSFASLQRVPLEKFLAQPGKAAFREIFNYTKDPSWSPRPNIEEWCYYMDADDAQAWGAWYANVLPHWIPKFFSSPESNEDWAWRVLWPHLERKST